MVNLRGARQDRVKRLTIGLSVMILASAGCRRDRPPATSIGPVDSPRLVTPAEGPGSQTAVSPKPETLGEGGAEPALETVGAPEQRAGHPVVFEEPDPARPSLAALNRSARFAAGREFEPVYFDDESADLRFSARKSLDEYAQWLIEHNGVWVTLEGHADRTGTVELNMLIGMSRAFTVEDRLAELGVAGDRLFTISYGEERPVATGLTSAEMAINRRVELLAFLVPSDGLTSTPAQLIPTAPQPRPSEPAPPTAKDILEPAVVTQN